MKPEAIEARRLIGIWLSENCNKPANSLNGVSFGEMMAGLGRVG